MSHIPSRNTQLCISLAGRPGTFGVRFHNHLYQQLGLDFYYKAMRTDDLPAAVAGIRALGLEPASVLQPETQALGSMQLMPLINSTPAVKQQIWQSLRAAVAADGQLLLDELLVLQGVALLLEIPIDSAPAASGF